jgi:RNA polymerase sigma factor (sigma-70 family)
MLCQWSMRRTESTYANRSYVVGIVMNKVADWYRAHRRFVPLPDEEDLPPSDDAYDDVIDRQSVFKEVRRVLESCAAVSRMVGILYFLHDFTPARIAELLDMNPSTVRTHVARLRKRLRHWSHAGWTKGETGMADHDDTRHDDAAMREDEAARNLVRRAYAADPGPDDFDALAGLRRIRERAGRPAVQTAETIQTTAGARTGTGEARVVGHGTKAEALALPAPAPVLSALAATPLAAHGPAADEMGTLTVMSAHGGIRTGRREGRRVRFGRNESDVDVSFGVGDPMISRVQGEVVCRDGDWWLRNLGRSPIQLATATRLVFSGEEWGPLPDGSTQLFVTGRSGRQHLLGLHIGEGSERREVEPDHPTTPSRTWDLDPTERLAVVVLGQRYLRNELYPRPLSRREATEQLATLEPDVRWTQRRVEHVTARLRARLSRSGVAGLTRDEVGEAGTDIPLHNLIVALVESSTLTGADLEVIDRMEGAHAAFFAAH